jgi:hypothetical protein
LFHTTAFSLAADRQTKSLPIIYSLFLFIHAFVFAFFKTTWSEKASLEHPKGKWINIEAHSIGFSALLLYLIPAVYISSIIGVSQTAEEVPRKLNSFRDQLVKMKAYSDLRNELQDADIHGLFSLSSFPDLPDFPKTIPLPDWDLDGCPKNDDESRETKDLPDLIPLQDWNLDGNPDKDDMSSRIQETKAFETLARFKSGAIYSSNPGVVSQKNLVHEQPFISLTTRAGCHTAALLMVFSSVVIACTISSEVLPGGWNCRLDGEIGALGVWLISWIADFAILKFAPDRHIYRCMFTKDLLTGLAISIMIIVTQWGIFHRCECYSKNGIITNPLDRPIGEKMDKLFMHEWLYITLRGIVFQLASCVAFSWWYIVAFRVYLQRDDGRSNFDPIWLVGSWLQNVFYFLERQRI